MTLARILSWAALTAAFGAPADAGQGNLKLDESLRGSIWRGCSGARSVIIRTNPGSREVMRKSPVEQGRRVRSEFPALDAITADVSCADLKALAGFRETASVSYNANIYGHQLPPIDTPDPLTRQSTTESTLSAYSTIPSASTTFNSTLLTRFTEALSAQRLQSNLFSTLGVRSPQAGTPSNNLTPSVGVAVIDSGIAPGVDFGARITAFYDFTHGDIRVAAPSDAYGHGTHVGGLAASTYVGVAPLARLIGLKVLNSQGQGSTDNVIRAIEFAIINKDALKIDVINLSLGHPIFESAATDPLVQAVEHASRAGIVVAISAGNFGRNKTTGEVGYAGIASPGNAPSGISIGSVRTFDSVSRDDDRIAGYSSRGPSWYDGFAKPDISAPGDNLLSVASLGSTLWLLQERPGYAGNYMRLSGTSMAAAVVSGVIAVILQQSKNLTPNALKMVLQYSSIAVKGEDGTRADVLTQGSRFRQPWRRAYPGASNQSGAGRRR